MVKLYYTPTYCGAASFIAARAAGVVIDCELVNLATKVTYSGADFLAINKQGNVPALVLDDGTVLCEGAAVLQWIADQAPGKVAPENCTSARYHLQNSLNFIATELHKAALGPLFNSSLSAEVRQHFLQVYDTKMRYLNDVILNGKQYLVGDKPSVADYYLFIVLTWCPMLSLDLSKYPTAQAFRDRIGSLSYVIKAQQDMDKNPATTA